MNTIEKQRAHFENISETYYLSRQGKAHLLLKDLLWNYFLSNKRYLKRKRLAVLEPMCGYAEGKSILEKSLKIALDYTGFDYSKNLVEKIKLNNPSLNVSVMDVTKFSSLKKYDLIIVIGGLHHVRKYVDVVISSLYKSLNEGGYFIYFEPTHNNLLFKKIRERIYKKNNFFDNETEQAFELKKLNELFIKNKLSLVDQIYPGLISYILFYNPDAFPFFNFKSESLVKFLFKFDSLFFRNIIGKKLSFATMAIYKK